VDIIKELKPNIILLENVPRLIKGMLQKEEEYESELASNGQALTELFASIGHKLVKPSGL
jgi:site-specific DNA-cytosine methylase